MMTGRDRAKVRFAAVRAASLAGLLLVACGDPRYVSLGSIDAPVREQAAADAGADAGAGAPSGVECLPSSDVATSAAFDCASSVSPPPPRCDFGSAAVELAAACDGRPLLACSQVGETPALRLSATLSSVLHECGARDEVVTVRFERGCAVAFELESDSAARASVPPDASAADAGLSEAYPARDCLSQRLAAQRFDCAAEIPCAQGATFAIPTE